MDTAIIVGSEKSRQKPITDILEKICSWGKLFLRKPRLMGWRPLQCGQEPGFAWIVGPMGTAGFFVAGVMLPSLFGTTPPASTNLGHTIRRVSK